MFGFRPLIRRSNLVNRRSNLVIRRSNLVNRRSNLVNRRSNLVNLVFQARENLNSKWYFNALIFGNYILNDSVK